MHSLRTFMFLGTSFMTHCFRNSLLYNGILDLTKLETFADDNVKVAEKIKLVVREAI